MKMPEKIDTQMLAPCGINCTSCEFHCNKNDPCPGCLISNIGKRKSTLKCKIKACYDKKTFKYCGRCSEFPCKLIKKQDKNYKKRYNFSTLESAKRIQNKGIGRMMDEDRLKWICPDCEGIITLQDNICSECEKNFKESSE